MVQFSKNMDLFRVWLKSEKFLFGNTRDFIDNFIIHLAGIENIDFE